MSESCLSGCDRRWAGLEAHIPNQALGKAKWSRIYSVRKYGLIHLLLEADPIGWTGSQAVALRIMD